jgi:hypothetical protein
MAPELRSDPLAVSYDEDPALRRMFDVHEPVQTPGDLAPPDAAPSSPTTPPHSWLKLPQWLSPTSAWAAASDLDLTDEIRTMGKKLKGRVLDRDNLKEYSAQLDQLLQLSAEREAELRSFEPLTSGIYILLVKTAAWQESCWRQFVREGDRITFLKSQTGDIGLMQVNKHVWRGFYSLARLQWDVAYNAGAGAEILGRLMMQCAVPIASLAPEGKAVVARASYSAYNGGPTACMRWRRADAPLMARHIDEAFWQKYQVLDDGDDPNLLECAAQWTIAAGH